MKLVCVCVALLVSWCHAEPVKFPGQLPFRGTPTSNSISPPEITYGFDETSAPITLSQFGTLCGSWNPGYIPDITNYLFLTDFLQPYWTNFTAGYIAIGLKHEKNKGFIWMGDHEYVNVLGFLPPGFTKPTDPSKDYYYKLDKTGKYVQVEDTDQYQGPVLCTPKQTT
ncbi:unnamed protein product [Bursaphelenchus xylophilus]|uniref:(pine wood nematode) hypothetical protein n=1 Tax=Bursaphelenchus xylophilus TaxID=6326 RepID=A0A1I7RID7_BURXY|nr:unnamed protein product [Bursaphelenchus xylophilus]CAG9080897.1 unnamed protein product [Bursaphelenchus xylophilus]